MMNEMKCPHCGEMMQMTMAKPVAAQTPVEAVSQGLKKMRDSEKGEPKKHEAAESPKFEEKE